MFCENINSMDRCFAMNKLNKPIMDDTLRRGEKKRQQSRTAAKSRRLTESEIFNQLIETLPTIDQPTIYQLDRIGALRLALTLCRVRRVGERFFETNNDCGLNQEKYPFGIAKTKLGRAIVEDANTQHSMDACVEGFLMVVNKVGQLLFVTPGIAESIGFTQIDLVGRYLRDYVHTDDWRELREHLCTVGNGRAQTDLQSDIAAKTFFRMKTALTPRGGRARKLTMAVYQPLQAYIVKPSVLPHNASFEGFDYDEGANTTAEMDEDIRLMHCIPFTLSSSRRSPTEVIPSITSRHDLDMRFRICDETLAHYLGFKNAKSFIGRSYYDMIHPDDVQYVVRDVREMYEKCHSRTGYYRLLNRLGESVWVMSEMLLLVQNIRGVSQKSVVCAHQILSESENSTMDLPRMLEHNRLEHVKEFDVDEDECGYIPSDVRMDCDNGKPKMEPLTPSQTIGSNSSIKNGQFAYSAQDSPLGLAIDSSPIEHIVKVSPITQINQCTGQLCSDPGSEKSRSLAPFIARDNQTLTPLDDAEIPGLLPTFWDQWLCANPKQPHHPGCPKAQSKPESPAILENQNLLSNDDILPLDFADIFDMDIADTNRFSIDEAEHAFEQFEQSNVAPKIDEQSGRHDLSTPGIPQNTNWASSSEYAVPIPEGHRSRKRSFSMYSGSKKGSPEEPERRSRLDTKTIESFETAMMASPAQTNTNKSLDDDFLFSDIDTSYLMRPRSRSLHYKSAEAKQIDSIQRELYRETQRFLA